MSDFSKDDLLNEFNKLSSETKELNEKINDAILKINAKEEKINAKEEKDIGNDVDIKKNDTIIQVQQNNDISIDSQEVTLKSGIKSTIGDIKRLLREKINQVKKNKNANADKYSSLLKKINESKSVVEVQEVLDNNFGVSFKNGKVMGGRTKRVKNKTTRKVKMTKRRRHK